MIFLYNIAFVIFAIGYLPFFFLKARQAESSKDLVRQRLGIFSQDFKEKLIGSKIVWIHAVSVGEVLSVQKFIQEFLAASSEYHVVLSTVTPTGQKVAKKHESERLTVCYFPFDVTGAVRSFLKVMDPECLLLVETEIWPNLLTEAKRLRIPVGILNARLSHRSARRYKRFGLFFKRLFQSLDFVLVQNPQDGERFLRAGVKKERVHVLGNMKFDNIQNTEATEASRNSLREEWGFSKEDLILVAGSTHQGEEKILCRILGDLKPTAEKPVRMLLAPRHIERSSKLARYFARNGFRARLSAGTESKSEFDILILNQLGVLKQLYAIADAVFVGGSLIRHGGQNPIEAAQFKRAILHGPYVANFEHVYRALDTEGGAIVVQDSTQLEYALARILRNTSEAKQLGENAYRVVGELRGATQRHVEWLNRFLKNKSQTGAEPVERAASFKTDYARSH